MQTATEETITPTKAKAYLATMKNNRSIGKTNLTAIVEQIRNGEWRQNGETISFDDAGCLRDGQHRLAAVAQTKKSIRTWVIRGIPADAFTTINTGKMRSPADVLNLAGYTKNSSAAAASVRVIAALSSGQTIHRTHITRTKLVKLFEALDPRFHLALDAAVSVYPTAPKGVLAGVLYAASESGVYTAEVLSFAEGLRTGAGLTVGSPILTLREWFARIRGAQNKPNSDTKLNAVVVAWNAYAQGRELSVIKSRTRPHIIGSGVVPAARNPSPQTDTKATLELMTA